MRPILTDEIKLAINAVMKTKMKKALIHDVSIDSRESQTDKIFFAIRGERFDGHSFIDQVVHNGATAVVVDRDIAITPIMHDREVVVYKVQDTVEALGRLAKYYRSQMIGAVQIIAVTGSNGKTTVREMIHHVLSTKYKSSQSPRNFNNAIGVPLSLISVEHDQDYAVIELGTNAPGEIHYLSGIAQPDIAVITSVGPSHLEGLKSIDGVCAEKASIASGLKRGGTVVCCSSAPDAITRLQHGNYKIVTFGLNRESHVHAVNIKTGPDGNITFETNDRCTISLPIPGRHNVSNALAALAVCRRMDITTEEFAEAIKSFNAVGGRLNIQKIGEMTVIDDSYNANPASMAAALDVLDELSGRRRIFCCGDMGELGELAKGHHHKLGDAIALSKTDILLTAGELSKETANAAVDAGLSRNDVFSFDNSEQAAVKLVEIARPDDIILVKGSRMMKMENIVKQATATLQ